MFYIIESIRMWRIMRRACRIIRAQKLVSFSPPYAEWSDGRVSVGYHHYENRTPAYVDIAWDLDKKERYGSEYCRYLPSQRYQWAGLWQIGYDRWWWIGHMGAKSVFRAARSKYRWYAFRAWVRAAFGFKDPVPA